MQHHVICTLFACLFLFQHFNATAQDLKWGKIPAEDLSMTSFAPDPDANAVILGNVGIVSYRDDVRTFKYHMRIKLLKSSAFDRWGKVEIHYTPAEEKFIDLDAQVIAPDGTITKVKNSDIFDEKPIKGEAIKKIAFPNLTEGCIVEYRYTFSSESIHIPSWSFQSIIPVRKSKYDIMMPTPYEYVVLSKGRTPDVANIELTSDVYGQDKFGREINYTRYLYEMNNVPALKEEAHITTMKDYIASLRFQLKGIAVPGIVYKQVLTTWPKLADEMRNDSKIGDIYTKKRNYADAWEALQPRLLTAKTKMDTISIAKTFLNQSMQWDGDFACYSEGTSEAFAKKKGNSADFNLLLIGLLNEAGLNAHPVLISTRDHGKPFTTYPIWSQFNHVIAAVETTDKGLVLVDAFDEELPAGLPHTNSLNKEGFIIKPKTAEWIPLKPERSTKSSVVKMSLDNDGVLNGNIQTQYDTYQAHYLRHEYKDAKDQDDYIQQLIVKKLPEAKITNFKIENNKNEYEKLKQSFDISLPNYVQTTNNLMYFNPMLHEIYKDNPFKMEQRDYPVEMVYPFRENYLFSLQLPQGYAVESLPKDSKVELPEKAGSFSYTFSQKNNEIQVSMRFNIEKTTFMPEEYSIIKQFYDMVVTKQGEQIVLKKL